MKFIKRNKFSLFFVFYLIVLAMIWPEKGIEAVSISLSDARVILSVLPPILILIGLFDVWIPKEVVIRHMGANSGVRGTALAFFLELSRQGLFLSRFQSLPCWPQRVLAWRIYCFL